MQLPSSATATHTPGKGLKRHTAWYLKSLTLTHLAHALDDPHNAGKALGPNLSILGVAPNLHPKENQAPHVAPPSQYRHPEANPTRCLAI